jgi:hypothetical protein
LARLCDKVVGTRWYIQVGEEDPTLLLDWIKANHPESKELKSGGDGPAKKKKGAG